MYHLLMQRACNCERGAVFAHGLLQLYVRQTPVKTLKAVVAHYRAPPSAGTASAPAPKQSRHSVHVTECRDFAQARSTQPQSFLREACCLFHSGHECSADVREVSADLEATPPARPAACQAAFSRAQTPYPLP